MLDCWEWSGSSWYMLLKLRKHVMTWYRIWNMNVEWCIFGLMVTISFLIKLCTHYASVSYEIPRTLVTNMCTHEFTLMTDMCTHEFTLRLICVPSSSLLGLICVPSGSYLWLIRVLSGSPRLLCYRMYIVTQIEKLTCSSSGPSSEPLTEYLQY